jgi:hypothetical protein
MRNPNSVQAPYTIEGRTFATVAAVYLEATKRGFKGTAPEMLYRLHAFPLTWAALCAPKAAT